uniref:Uncharacterized protein n=1 Tax=Arundo donax TaxID=35708 RepID=A0A0A9HS28_ARUDO
MKNSAPCPLLTAVVAATRRRRSPLPPQPPLLEREPCRSSHLPLDPHLVARISSQSNPSRRRALFAIG